MKKATTRQSNKVKLIIGLAVLVAVVAFGLLYVLNRKDDNSTAKQPDTSEVKKNDSHTDTTNQPNKDQKPPEDSSEKPDQAAVIDPATLNVIEVSQARLAVFYVKGIGSLEYEVLRSSDGRKYVEFRNPELIGTKCEDDLGVFVSILESPNSSEQTTVSNKVSVEGVEYGLSVASPTCTSNAELLTKYQDAFIKPFSLLKKLN